MTDNQQRASGPISYVASAAHQCPWGQVCPPTSTEPVAANCPIEPCPHFVAAVGATIAGQRAALEAAEARGRAEAVARAVQAVEALRPHIPPSTDPDRRTRVIQRSSFNRAASAVRALVTEKDVP